MEEKIIVRLEADIADLKTQLGAAQNELKRFGLDVQTSINDITLDRLNLQLKQLQTQLGATSIGSAAFKNIGAEIALVENQINGALTSINANANRSRTGFNGLNNSINQITRELPAFGLSANIGFLAISNNLPILVDEINKVRVANKALAAEGMATSSVFKSLSAALFSWQTALSLGVTLLTIYGGKIVEMISNLFQGKEAITNAKAELDALNETYADKSIQGVIGDIVLLKSSLETASKSIVGQNQFIEQYNRTIGTVTGSVDTFKAAEQGIIDNTDAYVAAMIARATATNLAAKAGEITTKMEDLRVEHAKQNAIDQIDGEKQFSAEFSAALRGQNVALLESYGTRTNYIRTKIAEQKAIRHAAQKEELSSYQTQLDNIEKLTKKYYTKSGLITPYVKPAPTKTERPLDMEFIPTIGIKLFNNEAIKLDQNLKAIKTTLEGFKDTEPILILEPNQIQNIENVVNLLGGALSSAFDAALTSGDNFFKVMWRGLTNLLYKLAAAAVAALVLSVLLAPFSGGAFLASVGGFEGIFSKLTGFDISGIGGDSKSVFMPNNAVGQGNYQIDIMGDKMRLLLDNTAIKNTRVI